MNQTENLMQIEIWTDIICPWCGLGHARLKKAMSRLPYADEIDLVHRSFQLDPHFPQGEVLTTREMLSRKRGFPDAQIDQMTRHIEELAAVDGLIPYHVTDNYVGNTSLAHELAIWARDSGKSKQAWDALYNAYFGEVRSIFDVESLVTLATEIGLDADEAREVLISRRYREVVRSEHDEAVQLGANGVPFIVIDRRYAISGAQPVDQVVAAIEQAWNTTNETVR